MGLYRGGSPISRTGSAAKGRGASEKLERPRSTWGRCSRSAVVETDLTLHAIGFDHCLAEQARIEAPSGSGGAHKGLGLTCARGHLRVGAAGGGGVVSGLGRRRLRADQRRRRI